MVVWVPAVDAEHRVAMMRKEKENTSPGRPQSVAELARHNCLQYTLSRVSGAGTWIFRPDRKTRVQVTGSLKANNGDALVAAAIAGQGIVYQPAFLVAREIAAGLYQPA